MTIKLLAQENGRTLLIDFDAVSGANTVLRGVDCDASVYVGAVVRVSGGVAFNAIADSLANSNMIGIVESKGSSVTCDIRVSGVTANTIFSGLDETKEYYLSATVEGEVTLLPPTTSGSVLLKIGQPFDSESMLVSKGIRTVRL